MTSRHLGDLGTVREPLELTFGYFGLVVRVHPDVGDLDLVEFMMNASGVDEADQVQGMLALGRYLKNLVHPDDWHTFWAAAKGNRQSLKDLMFTAHTILEAVTEETTGFPTGQPSASSGGRQSTAAKSPGGSSSRDTTRQALQLLKGRPDLQVAVLRAQEAGKDQTALTG